MQNGYYDVTGAMVTQFNRLNVISNNLANLNTTAFKRDDVVVGDFKRIFQEYKEEMPLRDNTKEASKFVNAAMSRVPHIVEQYIKYEQGGIKNTGNALDFALKRDDAFFMVETPNGIRLTQNGSFTLNNVGILTTKEGYPVLPSTYFQNKQYIEVPEDGELRVNQSGALFVGDDEIGQMYLVKSDDIKSLTKEGESLYAFKSTDELTQLENGDFVAQGFLETSNINPVSEMVGLIETNRLVEMYQKVMKSHMNDLNSDAISKLASTKA
ncbi:flagellar hook-basal body protein [Sulfurospirillum deleyianum]|uniref:Fagellar hook-basal body protein n=1 Tax=Sulfurospirillum deleyianum (strain ATCC 51133 / DSM 6946 / 5175) TaxID=525898 RepID=D1B391_SULD5|nr:flagellar hook-basal body protein [Sulfurospirillum deleyianum]ACZ12561.1 fagellar hook-basal body protein [Sulfurospirillum deleyianum DSM 6946]